jgi:recombinational DNA repair protein (RecF pathway)
VGRSERKDRSGHRIELLNARWHHHGQSPGFRRCAVCGAEVSESVRAVYREGELFHARCVHYRAEPT